MPLILVVILSAMGMVAARGDTAKTGGSVEPRASVPDIPGIAEQLAPKPGNAFRGRLAVISRRKGNCLVCHQIPSLEEIQSQGTIGPKLEKLTDRYSEAQLRQLLVDARVFYPTTIMPPYGVEDGFFRVSEKYRAKAVLVPQEIEDVLAFLKSLP